MSRPIIALRDDVAAILLAAGDDASHVEGAEHLAMNDAPPRYLWIERGHRPSPKGTDVQSDNPEDDIAIAAFDNQFEVRCWAEDVSAREDANAKEKHRDAAFDMRDNLLSALDTSSALGGNIRVLGGDFLRPNEAGWPERGAVYVLALSLERTPVLKGIRPMVDGKPTGSISLDTAEIETTETVGQAQLPTGDEEIES